MKQKTWEYVEQLHMIQEGDCVLVACSGGADSVALLRLLWERHEEGDYELEAIHVEHGIRGEESKRDEEFVRGLCEDLGIPVYCESVDVPGYASKRHLGMEEAARILRYEVLEKRADCLQKKKGKTVKIALAHHEEDNVETVLFQMARGSGLGGMCGIAPIRKESGHIYIRPLLQVSRPDIEGYLKELGQGFCVDGTNADENYSRNFIRNQIMPLLSQLNERAFAHVNQMTQQLTEVKDYLESEIGKAWREHVKTDVNGGCSCECAYLCSLMPALQKALLMRMIAYSCGGRKDLSAAHVEAVVDLLSKQTGAMIRLPGNVEARMQYGSLFLQKEREHKETDRLWACVDKEYLNRCLQEGGEYCLDCGEGQLYLSVHAYHHTEEEIQKKTYTKTFDYDKIKDGFSVRNKRTDDVLVIDAKGHHKSLRSYMIDAKIPAEERGYIPLLANGNEIIWCIGQRIGENYKVTESTNYVVDITYQGGSRDGHIEA